MTSRRLGPGVALVVAGLFAAATSWSAAEEAVLCTVADHGRIPRSTTTFLLGRAMADTVMAGPGAVRPNERPGHWGDGEPRVVHGQLFRVERLGGADSVLVARTLAERGDSAVLLVPWDYDSACRPTYWSPSARWIAAGAAGVFRSPRLRPEGEWVGGVPTFDVFMASLEPYPVAPRYVAADSVRARDGRALTAGEYYDLYASLPRLELILDRPDAALAALHAWEEQHHALVEVDPAPALRWHVESVIRPTFTRLRLDAIDSPAAGTWRFTFSLNDGGARDLYARTRPRPSTPWSPRPRTQPNDPSLPPPAPEGYHLLVSGAPAIDDLPGDCRRDRQIDREAYLMILDPGRLAEESRGEWIGEMDLRLLARAFPEDSALAAFQRGYFQERYRERPDDVPFTPDGTFSRTADGAVRFDQRTVLRDGRTLEIRGELISGRTIACDW